MSNIVESSSEERPSRILTKGWAKSKLINELAMGVRTQKSLADEFGVVSSTITEFKKRHKAEIELRKERLMDNYSDLWIADKRNRLAELQAAAEGLIDKPINPRTAEVIAKLLRDAAEELGDIPNRSQVNVNSTTTYEIVGIPLEGLT